MKPNDQWCMKPNDQLKYLPTPQEIKAVCALIRAEREEAKWEEEVRVEREEEVLHERVDHQWRKPEVDHLKNEDSE